MLSVLVIEDDIYSSNALQGYLTRAGHTAVVVTTAEEGLVALGRELFDVVLADLQLPGMTGIEFLREQQSDDAPPVIVVTGDSDVNTAVAVMRAGAADYVAKPLTMKTLEHVLVRVVETARLKRQVDRLQRETISDPNPASVAISPGMIRALELARRCANSSASAALLVGESGSGKEVVAAYMHRSSPRSRGPFVRINVAAIPETMMEAELFGAVRGAFTDSRRDRQGFFSAADNGTLLLDEIGELRPELQAKLLRAIETRRFYPVGASREIASDVRIIAATNRDPGEAVASGKLRPDLYYRLSTMVIRVPSLRERREDIPALARTVLASLRRSTGRGPDRLDEEALLALQAYDWPGNVRELRNALERVTLLIDTEIISPADLHACGIFAGVGLPRGRSASVRPPPPPMSNDAPAPVVPPAPASVTTPASETVLASLESIARTAYEEAERRHIVLVLERTRGNRTRAAELLQISRSTLWQKLRRHGLDHESS